MTKKQQQDKQRSTKHYTTDRAIRTTLKTRMTSCIPEGWEILATQVALIVFLKGSFISF